MDFYLICSVKTTPATGFFYIIYSVKTNIFKYPWNTRLGNALGDVQGDPEGTSLVLLGPASLLTAELLVIQGPFNGELCWEWFFFFPGLQWEQQDQSILSRWIKELIRKGCLGCSQQNLLRLLNGLTLCPRGKKRLFPLIIVRWALPGLGQILGKCRKWISGRNPQHRNGECRREKISCACLCHLPFSFSFPPFPFFFPPLFPAHTKQC